MSERDLTKEMKLSAKEWKELHEGVIFMTDFLRENPRGVKDLMDKAKEGAKGEVARGILGDITGGITGLLTPIINELDGLLNTITGELGLTNAITKIKNSVFGFLGSLASLLGSVVSLFFDSDTNKDNLENIRDWMQLFNPLTYQDLLRQVVNIFIPTPSLPSEIFPPQPLLLVTPSDKTFDFGDL